MWSALLHVAFILTSPSLHLTLWMTIVWVTMTKKAFLMMLVRRDGEPLLELIWPTTLLHLAFILTYLTLSWLSWLSSWIPSRLHLLQANGPDIIPLENIENADWWEALKHEWRKRSIVKRILWVISLFFRLPLALTTCNVEGWPLLHWEIIFWSSLISSWRSLRDHLELRNHLEFVERSSWVHWEIILSSLRTSPRSSHM